VKQEASRHHRYVVNANVCATKRLFVILDVAKNLLYLIGMPVIVTQ